MRPTSSSHFCPSEHFLAIGAATNRSLLSLFLDPLIFSNKVTIGERLYEFTCDENKSMS